MLSCKLVVRVLIAVNIACVTLNASHAHAADMMPEVPLGNDTAGKPVELGSGWYLRGDLGLAKDNTPNVGVDGSLPTTRVFHDAWTAGGGFGYRFTNSFRTDITADYRSSTKSNGNGATACEYGVLGTAGGYRSYQGLCDPHSFGRLSRATVLLNGYYDFNNFNGITPYIGAGAGTSILKTRGSSTWTLNNGSPYTDLFTQTFDEGTPIAPKYVSYTQHCYGLSGHPNCKSNSATSSKTYNFAWALMAGVAVPVDAHADIDLGYRYINQGSRGSDPNAVAHEVRVGLRYKID